MTRRPNRPGEQSTVRPTQGNRTAHARLGRVPIRSYAALLEEGAAQLRVCRSILTPRCNLLIVLYCNGQCQGCNDAAQRLGLDLGGWRKEGGGGWRGILQCISTSSNSRFQEYNGWPGGSLSSESLDMELKVFFLLIFASNALGQAILSVLATHLELSTFNYYVNASTNLTNLLSTADNFTLLAPSNTAFEQWFSGQGNPSLSNDVIEATLFYHLLHGGFPTTSFTEEPQFVASHLENATYSNVTGGQRVGLVTGTGGQQQFIADNNTITGIVSPVSVVPQNRVDGNRYLNSYPPNSIPSTPACPLYHLLPFVVFGFLADG